MVETAMGTRTLIIDAARRPLLADGDAGLSTRKIARRPRNRPAKSHGDERYGRPCGAADPHPCNDSAMR
jgi:hypothetical protein